MKCPYCKKDSPETTHIYGCSKSFDKVEIKYEYIIYNFPELSKEYFKKLYVNSKYFGF